MDSISLQDSLNIPEFASSLKRIRTEINYKFKELIKLVKGREEVLLSELDEIAASYEARNKPHIRKLEELKEMHSLNKSNFESSGIHNLQSKILDDIESEIIDTKKKISVPILTLSLWDNSLEDTISNIGSLREEFSSQTTEQVIQKPQSKYENKVKPLLSACRNGNALGELNNPWGLAIDHFSGDLYVSDQLNSRVQVLDSEGNFKFCFPDSSGKKNIRQPVGIAISKQKVFVCEACSGKILVFDLTGHYLNKFGSKIKSGTTLYGIAVSDITGVIYVCDYQRGLVQTYSADLIAKEPITGFENPCSVHLTDSHIIILDKRSPCLHWYDFNGKQDRSLIRRGKGEQVDNVASFCLDRDGNILMTDSYNVKIFNNQGCLLHQIHEDIHFPTGILIDGKGRIVLLSYRSDNCLQMF